MKYSDKLKDPRWQKRRLQIFERDGWACTECGRANLTLHVHHLAYTGEPWDAPDEALRTICEPCHSTGHNDPQLFEQLKFTMTVLRDHGIIVDDLTRAMMALFILRPMLWAARTEQARVAVQFRIKKFFLDTGVSSENLNAAARIVDAEVEDGDR